MHRSAFLFFSFFLFSQYQSSYLSRSEKEGTKEGRALLLMWELIRGKSVKVLACVFFVCIWREGYLELVWFVRYLIGNLGNRQEYGDK